MSIVNILYFYRKISSSFIVLTPRDTWCYSVFHFKYQYGSTDCALGTFDVLWPYYQHHRVTNSSFNIHNRWPEIPLTGFLNGRWTWRLSRWNMLAGVDGLQINQLISWSCCIIKFSLILGTYSSSSLHICKNLSIRPEECSGPIPVRYKHALISTRWDLINLIFVSLHGPATPKIPLQYLERRIHININFFMKNVFCDTCKPCES